MGSSLLHLAVLAGLASASAIPQFATPKLYNTTDETAAFDLNEIGFNNPMPSLPGVYKDLYYDMGYFNYRTYSEAYTTYGIYPIDGGIYQGGGVFQGTNGSSGSITTNYPNSTIDHFYLKSFVAGCQGTASFYVPDLPPGDNTSFPYPVNCTIHAKGYNSKLNPLGTPLATTSFKYRPVLQKAGLYPPDLQNGTAAMQVFAFPSSFQFLDKITMTATLDNVPPSPAGDYFVTADGIDVKISYLKYSISKLQPSI